ncbi:MAG: hypothetical protein ACTSQU_19155, partial [Promethearchaeota archaeon]
MSANWRFFKSETVCLGVFSCVSDEEIRHFFEIFPYSIDSEVTNFDILISVRLEIEFYDDL